MPEPFMAQPSSALRSMFVSAACEPLGGATSIFAAERDDATPAPLRRDEVAVSTGPAVGEAGIVHSLVTWSERGVHVQRAAVAEALAFLSKSKFDARGHKRGDDGISSLLRLLQNDTPLRINRSVSHLTDYLHEQDEGNANIIGKKFGCTDQEKESAVIALCDLVNAKPKNQSRFVQVGGLRVLMQEMTQGTAPLKRAACACICVVASLHGGNQSGFAAAGAFGPLVALARGGTPGQKAAALAALASLTYLHEGNQELLATAENLEILVALAESPGDEAIQAVACAVLRNCYDGIHKHDPKLRMLPSLQPKQDGDDEDLPWWADDK